MSSKGQADGDGLPRQRDEIEDFARRNGYEIDMEFKDVISRTTQSEDRPGFEKMVRTIPIVVDGSSLTISGMQAIQEDTQR